MTYPIVKLPQRSKADVGSNSHIAKKGHPGILSKPGKLVYDILHGNRSISKTLYWHPVILRDFILGCQNSSISVALNNSPTSYPPSGLTIACPRMSRLLK